MMAAETGSRNVAILGAGGMGTALAILLARSSRSVRLWARDPRRAVLIRESRSNELHLPDARLPADVCVTSDVEEATAGAELLVVAVPSKFLRVTLGAFAGRLSPEIPALSVVKGIELETFARPSEVIIQVLGARPLAVLSGPSHAEEIARGLPASLVVASDDEGLNVRVQESLNGPTLRVYTNSDPLGVELAGALKNVLGVAAGICDGLGLGDNAKAALLSRGLIEVARFACDQGARPSTFLGLAGVGDLITTCYSPFGRNRSVGFRLGQGATLAEILSGMSDVAEGVTTAQSAHLLGRKLGIPLPITDEVHAILYENKPPRAAVTDLMLRLPKVEWP